MSRKKEEVIHFLKCWKLAVHRFVDFVPRPKNLEGIKELGLTLKQAREMLRELAVENYVSGPEIDKDRKDQELWIFGLRVEKQEVYLKIKLFEYQGELRAKCLSFHPAEWPLKHPFKGGDCFETN